LLHPHFRLSLNIVNETSTILQSHGIQPTAQRLAIAKVILGSKLHPSADEVLDAVNHQGGSVSRATVFNTLNTFVEQGLCRALVLTEGHVVYDPNMERHHHLVDEDSGRIYDLPWDAVEVKITRPVEGFEVENLEVVVRGRRNTESEPLLECE
jgi:Fur family iron response transcriptional regulator